MSKEALEDACGLFSNYIETTKHIVRCIGQKPNYTYPQGPAEMDMLVFATIFSNVWGVIQSNSEFKKQYTNNAEAFKNLAALTRPDHELHKYNAYYMQDGNAPHLKVADVESRSHMQMFCRTLRNGFNHFNYRYTHLSPKDYFAKLEIPLPAGIPDPDTAHNYRIFICDYATSIPDPNDCCKKVQIKPMDAGANMRVLDVGFGHLRFHLYAFLEQFFLVECGRPAVSLLDLGI